MRAKLASLIEVNHSATPTLQRETSSLRLLLILLASKLRRALKRKDPEKHFSVRSALIVDYDKKHIYIYILSLWKKIQVDD